MVDDLDTLVLALNTKTAGQEPAVFVLGDFDYRSDTNRRISPISVVWVSRIARVRSAIS